MTPHTAAVGRRLAIRTKAALALSAWLLAAAPALAEDASEHAKKAAVAYDLQDWTTALAQYKEAFTIDPRPDYLFRIGQTQKKLGDSALPAGDYAAALGDYEAAIQTFKNFRVNMAGNESAMTAAKNRIDECEKAEAAATAAKQKKEAEEAAAARKAQEEKQERKQAFAEALPPPKPWYGDAFGDALVITGLAAAGVGAGFLANGLSIDARTRGFDRNLWTVMGAGGLVAGGTLIIDGVIRYVLAGRAPARTGSLHLLPTLGPRDAQLTIYGRF